MSEQRAVTAGGRTGRDLTIGDLVDIRRRDTPDHIFCRFEGRDVTCEALADDVDRIANALVAMGLRKGDRVGTMLSNGPGYVAMMLAILRLGLVWLPLNVQLKGQSLAYLLEHAEPAHVVANVELVPTLEDAWTRAPSIVPVRSDAELVASMVARGGRAPSIDPTPFAAGPGDVVAIMYTSGTTGMPKGVELTDRMLRTCARGVSATVQAKPGDVLFHWEALNHIAGNQVAIFALQERVTLAMQPRFSASRFWPEAAAAGARYVHYVGSILQILLKQPPSPIERTHGVEVMWGGGCPREIWDVVRQRFGVEVREVWGMTETSSISTVNVGGPVGSVGRALPAFEVRIDALGGSGPARAGASGQLVIREREPGVLTRGYFRNPEGTAALYRDGWLQTGDKAHMDEAGYVYFEGRLKDSIRCRGENVSAWEVEAVVNSNRDVLQSAAIGVPSDMGEEDIKVFVKVRDASSFSPAGLVAWCADRMPAYQVPRYVSVIDDFELTASNRIRKESLSRSTTDVFDRGSARPVRPASR